MSIQKYNRPYFYGGELNDMGEIRLLKAVITQALLDFQSSDKELQESAKIFLDSDDFKEYCRIIEGLY